MGETLNNPKEYFDCLSDEEFTKMLDEFNFNYIDIRDLTEEEKICFKEKYEVEIKEYDKSKIKYTIHPIK